MVENIQYLYKLIAIFAYSFFITYWTVPYVLDKLKKYGYTAQDKYKKGNKKIPSMGGIAILIGTLVSLALLQILLNNENLGNIFIFYFIVLVYALYGVIDDLFAFRKRYDKILILLVLSLPIASLINDTTLNLLFTVVDVGAWYALLFIPVYIMVVANLINLHAGYNGLTQGLSIIMLAAVGIKSFMVNGVEYMVFFLPIFGGALAFWKYNFFPAKTLPGNVGDFLVGAALGGLIVVNNFLWFGIFILIPHIINFLMDTYTIVIRKIPDVKFGSIRKDGTVKAPPTMKFKSLKFLIVSYFRLTEKQAVIWLYVITGIFCVTGIVYL